MCSIQFFHLKVPTTLIIAVVFSVICISGCQHKRPPLLLADIADLPTLRDDGSRQELLSCIRIQREYLKSLPQEHQLEISGTTYPLYWLIDSLDTLISILVQTPKNLEIHNVILENFDIFQATGRDSGPADEILFTGYFEPLFSGSLHKSAIFKFPLYTTPETLVTGVDQETGEKYIGRKDSNGELTDFWTRGEIENYNHLAGAELVYLSDPFDAFLIHVQGSARIKLPDGSTKSVRYAGNNGHPYNSIGKLLVDEGKITLAEASIPTIRHYIETHTDELQRILHHNPRFIFFQWGDDKQPKGSIGKPLTPGRSIAIDQKVLPKELFAWIQTQKPVIDSNGQLLEWIATHRFVLPQDSGAAIQGAGRVDLFWGSGLYAEKAAGSMKQPGELYFFIKKGFRPVPAN